MKQTIVGGNGHNGSSNSKLCVAVDCRTTTHFLTQAQWNLIQCELGISRKQMEVVRWMIEGYSPEQIAAAMHITVNSVKTHRERLYKTLGIHDKAGLFKPLLTAALKVSLKDH